MPDLDSLQKKILWMRLCFITEKNPVVNPFLNATLTLDGHNPTWDCDDNSYGPTPLSREKCVWRQITSLKQ